MLAVVLTGERRQSGDTRPLSAARSSPPVSPLEGNGRWATGARAARGDHCEGPDRPDRDGISASMQPDGRHSVTPGAQTASAAPTAAVTALAGTPVALVGGAGAARQSLRDALLEAGAAVATVGSGALAPPGTRWVVDLAGLPAGRGPGDDGRALGPESVVVVTGGARGIGATAAIGLARAFGCGIELVERSPLPPDDEPAYLAGRDASVAARQAIIGRGELGRPGEIAAELDRTLAAREIRRTVTDLAEHAAFVGYRALDVRDATALAAAIDDIRTRRGRFDGTVHVTEVIGGAGGSGVAGVAAAAGEVA